MTFQFNESFTNRPLAAGASPPPSSVTSGSVATGSHSYAGFQGGRSGVASTRVHPSAKGGVTLPGGIEISDQEVRRAIKARRKRDQFFGAGLFEDPGWDMILELFGSELEGKRVSVSGLCSAAAVAPTTALRWIKNLVDAGLFERDPDPFDRRRAFISLSDRAREQMHGYIADLRRTGVALA